jgi:hypothetical protein
MDFISRDQGARKTFHRQCGQEDQKRGIEMRNIWQANHGRAFKSVRKRPGVQHVKRNEDGEPVCAGTLNLSQFLGHLYKIHLPTERSDINRKLRIAEATNTAVRLFFVASPF